MNNRLRFLFLIGMIELESIDMKWSIRVVRMLQEQNLSIPGIEEIINRIANAVHPNKIYLFGSRARGDFQADSDFDLLVIYDGPISKRNLELMIYESIDKCNISLDLFILSSDEMDRLKSVANTLAREVSETGILCYE